MKTKLFKLLSVSVTATLVLGMIFFALPVGAVSAAGLSQEIPPPGEDRGGMRKALLERRYQNELKILERQEITLERADKFAARIETLIAKLKENGKDTTELEAALAVFTGHMVVAGVSHDEAAQILSNHAGFDENGKVVDLALARETVRSAGEALRETHQTMREALVNLRDAVKKWRQANPPEEKPVTP
jgi:hypothetical protein